jgi:hypothetical protein
MQVLSVFDGSVDVGENGELMAELLLLFARDKTVENGHYGPVLLKSFFECFLNENDYKALEERCQNIAELRGKDMNPLECGMISFNHFCRVSSCLNSKQLLEMYVRGIGVVCQKNQAEVDLVIPILMSTENDVFPLKAENMSYVLIQVKNRFKGKDSKYPGSAIMTPFSVIQNPNQNHFYFSMYMDVGSKTCRMDFPETLTTNDTSSKLQRISLALHGLDSSLYPVLKDDPNPQKSSEVMEKLKPYLEEDNVVEPMDVNAIEVDDQTLDIVQNQDVATCFTPASTQMLHSITGTSRKEKTQDGAITLLFRALLGRRNDPSSLQSNAQDKQIVESMCMSLYPDRLLSLKKT